MVEGATVDHESTSRRAKSSREKICNEGENDRPHPEGVLLLKSGETRFGTSFRGCRLKTLQNTHRGMVGSQQWDDCGNVGFKRIEAGGNQKRGRLEIQKPF